MPMKNPPHPGRIVRQECLEPLGLSVTDAAKALGASRNALSERVNERRGVSPEMAIRLAEAFGSSAAIWAGLQLDYDMARAMQHADRIHVRRVPQPVVGAEWGASESRIPRWRNDNGTAPVRSWWALPRKDECHARTFGVHR